MSKETKGSPITKIYGETVSLTTTAAHLLFRPDYNQVKMYCASGFRLGITPRLACVLYYSASGTSYTNYTSQAIGRNDAVHVPLDAMATGDYLYMGFTGPVRGVYINVDGTNKNTESATLDVEYSSTKLTQSAAVAFTDVSGDADGTTNGGATLTQDGLYAWTVPTAWVSTQLGTWAAQVGGEYFWIRFKPSATLSATVDLIDIIPACYDTNYGYEQGGIVQNFSISTARNGAFEFDHTGTDTLYIDWIQG